jgi:anthranilate/para-aminobenzoate synthase component II
LFDRSLTAVDPLVLHNDEVDIVAIQQLLASGAIHHIILSPGPGTPHNPKDIGAALLLPVVSAYVSNHCRMCCLHVALLMLCVC